MGFRTLEISGTAEMHIKEGQLEVTTEEGVVFIPIEDLSQIMVHGANIRLSTRELSILSRHKVELMTLDEKYLPTAISRQERRELAKVLHNAYVINGVKMNVLSAIDIMVESLKRIILDDSMGELKLPVVIPIESMEGITE